MLPGTETAQISHSLASKYCHPSHPLVRGSPFPEPGEHESPQQPKDGKSVTLLQVCTKSNIGFQTDCDNEGVSELQEAEGAI